MRGRCKKKQGRNKASTVPSLKNRIKYLSGTLKAAVPVFENIYRALIPLGKALMLGNFYILIIKAEELSLQKLSESGPIGTMTALIFFYWLFKNEGKNM